MNAESIRKRRNAQIKHISPEIPRFELPAIKGERYTDSVPDTLDLAERAAHAVHMLTASTDPEANAEIYWRANFGWKPPTMYHDANDWCEYKYYAPSLLLRLACGSEELLEVEAHRMANLLQMQGPDGLLYIPVVGRPWAREFNWGPEEDYDTGTHDHFAAMAMLGRQLEALAAYYQLTSDPQWLEAGKRAVDAIGQRLIHKGEFAYLTQIAFAPGETPVAGPPPPPNINHASVWLGVGLLGFHRMTGYEPALELGRKIAGFQRSEQGGFVGPNGEFQNSHGSRNLAPGQLIHFHMNTLTRILLLEAGLAANDRELIELSRSGYEWAKRHGEPLMGYFAENLTPDPETASNSCEFCEVAEMIHLGARMSAAGVHDYWDDVDRWLRNMFAEGQLTETGWAQPYSERFGIPLEEVIRASGVPKEIAWCTTKDVPERYRGSLGGWLKPNDWQGHPIHSAEACCNGNGAIALYKVWRDMIGYDSVRKRLTISLLMNRASKWADVKSHLPYRGQVDVTVKSHCELALRIPEWAQPRHCTCTVNESTATMRWEGRYLIVEAKGGDRVCLRFPIRERSASITILGREEDWSPAFQDYKLVLRGNEIVDISPRGERHPMFNRPHYRQEETRWRSIDRFVADGVVETYY